MRCLPVSIHLLFWGVASILFAGSSAPAVQSVSPAAGVGHSGLLQLVYFDSDGAGDFSSAGVLINTTVDGRDSCWVTYEPAANRFWLVQDAKLNWIYGSAGLNRVLENKYCALDLYSSSARLSGSTLTLNLALSFKAGFAGAKNVYLTARDRFGSVADFTRLGQWTVPAPSSAPIMAVTPESGTGLSQVFTFQYGNASRPPDFSWVNVRIPSASIRSSCWVAFQPATNTVSLMDDLGNWNSGTLGSSTLNSSLCAVDLSASSRVDRSDAFYLRLALRFHDAFAGYKTLYMRALDQNMTGEFEKRGTWNVTQPAITSARPGRIAAGSHWAAPLEYGMQSDRLGYQFAVTTVRPSDSAGLQQALQMAEQSGMQLIIGTFPSPYILQPDGTWLITPDGQQFLRALAARPAAVKAIFAFNEPYWTDPFTSAPKGCGGISASELRALRLKIRSIWPAAKIYHDIGDPESWTSAGASWQPCVGNKYEDQTDVADYVGIWWYPFSAGTYTRQQGLDMAYRASRFVTNRMRATPVFLAQSFACTAPLCIDSNNLVMPTASQIKDWNCSVRKVLANGSLISWYAWRQSQLYSDYLANHPADWAATTSSVCEE